jgi:hypothetical protein
VCISFLDGDVGLGYCLVFFGGLVGGGCSVVYYRSDGDTWFTEL